MGECATHEILYTNNVLKVMSQKSYEASLGLQGLPSTNSFARTKYAGFPLKP